MLLRAALVISLISTAWALKPYQRPNSRSTIKAVEDDIPADWLLPETVTPTEYDVQLKTYIEKFKEDDPSSFTFDGTVSIKITVKEAVDSIVLHGSDNMTYSAIALKNPSDDTVEDIPLNDDYNSTTNKLSLYKTEGTIEAGDYILVIVYTGLHGDDMHGFYRSSYVNEEGKTRWLVTTQFEAYDARRAFPCFDEPKYKALYTISIDINKSIYDDSYRVLSNMPLDGVPTLNGEIYTFKFQKSAKKISSYLVAFVISDFVPTPSATFEESKPFITWGQKRYTDDGKISQLAGPASLTIMKALTDVPFGYPKVDQIGIPDFSAGAMENWGLVTYRERLIFYNAEKNPTSQKQSVVTVTTHELAHQWFGDLVTLWWWADIWLNEGFATFFEYHASDQIQVPELNTSTWKLVNQMVVDEVQAGAFATDAQPNSRPLTKPVYRPGDIDANFDNIAYSKGGSVIRMWMHALGKDVFYTALKNYLNEMQEKNGTPEILLSKFEEAAGANALVKPTVDFVEWHTLAGYPVINVTSKETNFELTQERYLVSGAAEEAKWTIPITYSTDVSPDFEDTTPQLIFKKEDKTATIEKNGANWIILNKQQVGYYRVNYDNDGWGKLINLLRTEYNDIHENNRAQLLDDSLWLARSTRGYTSYANALNLTKYLVNEKELIPWKAALNGFNFLYGKLAGNKDLEPKLNAHISGLLGTRFNELSLAVDESDSHTTLLLRSLLASWACKLGLPDCVSNAQQLFSSLTAKDDVKIHPDILSTVICTGVRQGGQDTWDFVWSLYEATTDNAEQTQLLSSLGCASDENVVNSFLNKLLESSSGIRKQDLAAAYSAIYSGNPTNVAIAFKFLQDKYVEIANTFGGLDPLGGLLTGIAAKLGSAEDVAAMTKLSEAIASSSDKNVIAARVSAAAAVDIVSSNKDWLDQKQESIKVWLEENYPNGAVQFTVTFVTLLLPAVVSLIFTH